VTSEIYLHKRGRELTCWRRRREVAWCTLSSVSSSLLLVFLLCLSVLVLSLFLSVFSVFSLCRPGLPCFSFVLVFLSFPGFFLVFALLSAFLSFLFFQPSVPSLCVFFFFSLWFSPLFSCLLFLLFFCVFFLSALFAYRVCVLETKAKLGYAGFFFSSPVSFSFLLSNRPLLSLLVFFRLLPLFALSPFCGLSL
jgi:hypothetical protein